jgi:membrane protein
MKLRTFWTLVKTTFTQWMEAKPFQLAAALAYYTIFSLAPLLLIAIAVASLAFGREATEKQILSTFQGMIGPQGAEAIQTMLQGAGSIGSGILASIVGVVTLLIGAGGVIGQLHESLNTMWGVEPKPGRGLWGMIRDRFISFAGVLGLGFLLLVSLLITTALTAAIQFFSGVLPGGTVVWQAIELLVSIALITGLFALIFKLLPDAHIAWGDVWVGAALTAVLFTLGKFLIGLYLGHSGVTSTYGAAGSIVLILLWVYYSALILFFGAEFTQVYANTCGTGIRPTAEANAVDDKARPATRAASKDDSHTRRENTETARQQDTTLH